MTTPAVGLVDILRRASAEASGLAATTARAEAALHDVLDRLPGLPGGAGGDLQRIDLVRQGLEDLARLLELAAVASARGLPLSEADLRAATRLTDVSARLLAETSGADGVRSGPGDLHLF